MITRFGPRVVLSFGDHLFSSLDDDGHWLNSCYTHSNFGQFALKVIVLLKVIADLLVTNLVDN